MARILVVDDDPSIRRWAKRGLVGVGYEVEDAPDGATAIGRLREEQFDAVLTDLRMSGPDGVDILRAALQTEPRPAVIIMSGHGTIPIAVHAVQLGAFDFIQKPFPIEEIGMKIERALELRRLKYQIDYLKRTQPDIYDFSRIVGASGTLKKVLDIVRKVAKSNATLLIRGETGTGKELIAAAVHHNSDRAGRAFVKVNCAALHDNLLEDRPLRASRWRHVVSRRNRRHESADAGKSPARAAGAGIRTARRHEDDSRRRADPVGDEPRLAGDVPPGDVSRRSVLPAECATTGRATFASWKTSSNVRCYLRTGR
jgi:two-component system response regulator HydG